MYPWATQKSRIVSSLLVYGLVLMGFLYGQNGLTQGIQDEKISALFDLPFVPPLHRGEQPLVSTKDFSEDLQESYSMVRMALNGEAFSSATGRDQFFGGVFKDLVRADVESLLPVLRKVQEIRVLKVYESSTKEYSWFQIVLFSEPETLHLVVYLEKEENQWYITGVDTTSSNWEE